MHHNLLHLLLDLFFNGHGFINYELRVAPRARRPEEHPRSSPKADFYHQRPKALIVTGGVGPPSFPVRPGMHSTMLRHVVAPLPHHLSHQTSGEKPEEDQTSTGTAEGLRCIPYQSFLVIHNILHSSGDKLTACRKGLFGVYEILLPPFSWVL